MRLGRPAEAVRLFRGLVLTTGGVVLRSDVPDAFKINYATALLACDNTEGASSAMGEVADRSHPGVQRVRNAIRNWRRSLSLRQRLQWFGGTKPDVPVKLDFEPGELV